MTALLPLARQVRKAMLIGDPTRLFAALITLADYVGRRRTARFARRLLRRYDPSF